MFFFFFNSANLLKKNSFSFSSSENIFISTSIFERFFAICRFLNWHFFSILICHYTDFWSPLFQMIMSAIFQIIVPLDRMCFLKKKNNTLTFDYDVLKCNFPCIYSFEVHWGYSIYEPIYSLKYGEFPITTCLIHFFFHIITLFLYIKLSLQGCKTLCYDLLDLWVPLHFSSSFLFSAFHISKFLLILGFSLL